MTQDTTPAGGPVTLPPLLVELWRLLAAHRPAVRKARCFDRLRALVHRDPRLGAVVSLFRGPIAVAVHWYAVAIGVMLVGALDRLTAGAYPVLRRSPIRPRPRLAQTSGAG
jgi:hypothetical protein